MRKDCIYKKIFAAQLVTIDDPGNKFYGRCFVFGMDKLAQRDNK